MNRECECDFDTRDSNLKTQLSDASTNNNNNNTAVLLASDKLSVCLRATPTTLVACRGPKRFHCCNCNRRRQAERAGAKQRALADCRLVEANCGPCLAATRRGGRKSLDKARPNPNPNSRPNPNRTRTRSRVALFEHPPTRSTRSPRWAGRKSRLLDSRPRFGWLESRPSERRVEQRRPDAPSCSHDHTTTRRDVERAQTTRRSAQPM